MESKVLTPGSTRATVAPVEHWFPYSKNGKSWIGCRIGLSHFQTQYHSIPIGHREPLSIAAPNRTWSDHLIQSDVHAGLTGCSRKFCLVISSKISFSVCPTPLIPGTTPISSHRVTLSCWGYIHAASKHVDFRQLWKLISYKYEALHSSCRFHTLLHSTTQICSYSFL